ncbi:MAG: serine hydrolase [Clostridia bacterium]|nr:serine hydrolase [Clostridia bacterium]
MSARRLTRYQKRRAQKAAKVALGVFAALIVLTFFTVYYLDRYSLLPSPDAELHDKDDPGYIPVSAEPLDIEVSAKQAFVYDCNRGEIVYQKGKQQVVYPASTTKLLSILCALEHLSPDEVITPGEELSLVGEGSSIAYINENHRLTVEMLIEGMLLPSGNDAAMVLAAAAGNRMSDGEATGKDAVAVFVQGMNEYAKTLGAIDTHFTTPDGLAEDDHYTTLEDMILISRAAAENDIICRYASLAKDNVTYASGHTNTWVNTNAMLDPDSSYYHPAVTGLKTGSLDRNYCVITTVEQGGECYIIGIFGARDKNARFADTLTIIDHLFPAKEVTP